MNMEKPYDYFQFPNYGYILADLTKEDTDPIREEINKIYLSNFGDENTKFNNNLAGHIKKEFLLNDSHDHIEKLVRPFCQEYENIYNYIRSVNPIMFGKKFEIHLGTTWVNFQLPNEFNPVHEHGGLFSFVIWMNVPYKLSEEQEKYPDVPLESNQAAKFNFHYTTSLGKIATHSLDVDKSYENKLCVFPANMHHSVNPFTTSNEYRISVSGNFNYKMIDE